MRALDGSRAQKSHCGAEPHREHRAHEAGSLRLAARASALCCAGCGFHPLYGDARLAAAAASIYVEPVAERDGYELRNTLIDLLGSNGQMGGKAYRLQHDPERNQPGRGAAE